MSAVIGDGCRVRNPFACLRNTSMLRLGLLGASLETRNLGVAALSHSTVEACLGALPDAEMVLYEYRQSPRICGFATPEGKRQVPLVNLRFSKQPWQPNHILRLMGCALLLRCLPFAPFQRAMLRLHPVCEDVRRCTAMLSLAGGDSFSDIYGLRRFFYVALPQLLAIALQVPLILLPQTYGPYRSRLARWLAGFILRHADWVFTRDPKGANVAEELKVRTRRPIEFAHDMAFSLRPTSLPAETVASLALIPEGKPVFGLNLSGLLWMGGYSGDNMFGLNADYRGLVIALVRLAIDKLACHVLLVPHVLTGKGNRESDVSASEHLLLQLNDRERAQVTLPKGDLDQSQTKMLIRRCDLLVASRMHACIGALSQSIPAVGLAYSDKFIGVLGSVRATEMVVDLRKSSQTEVLAAVEAQFRSRIQTSSRLSEQMPSVVDTGQRLFRRLSQAGWPNASG